MKKSIFDIIKKQNGEAFAKAIRAYDSGIFDIPNLDKIVRYAGREAEPIMNFLISLKNIQIEEKLKHQDPIELLRQAGYDAYYADTLQKQNAIRKYFSNGEELCTFKDLHRFEKYYIINAIKKNVDKIKREDFKNPSREDEYGTSVISIQVLKTGGFISIKNRYNHSVLNPDNTFNSNPDQIIEGLSDAISYRFGVDFSSQATGLPENYAFINNQIIKFNKEIDNVYFGTDFYVKDGIIHQINKDYQLLIDYLILDLKEKHIYNVLQHSDDSFVSALNQEICGKKINLTIQKEKNALTNEIETHQIVSLENGSKLDIVNGCLVAVRLMSLKNAPDNFLYDVKETNPNLRFFSAPNLEFTGDYFLCSAINLERFDAPNLHKVGRNFLSGTSYLETLILPLLTECKDLFAYVNRFKNVSFPRLESVGENFLTGSYELTELSLPRLRYATHYFLNSIPMLHSIHLPVLEHVGNYALFEVDYSLRKLSFPSLKTIGNNFGVINQTLTSIDLPVCEKIGDNFLVQNRDLKELNLPIIQSIGEKFLISNATFRDFQVKLPFVSKHKKTQGQEYVPEIQKTRS